MTGEQNLQPHRLRRYYDGPLGSSPPRTPPAACPARIQPADRSAHRGPAAAQVAEEPVPVRVGHQRQVPVVPGAVQEVGYEFVDEVVWVKVTNSRRMAKSHGFYLQHAKEVCLVGRPREPAGGHGGQPSAATSSSPSAAVRAKSPPKSTSSSRNSCPVGNTSRSSRGRTTSRDYWVSVGNEVTGTGLPEEDEKAFCARRRRSGSSRRRWRAGGARSIL